MTRLGRSDCEGKADEVARRALGRYLIIEGPNRKHARLKLTEIAAYEGETKTSSKGMKYLPGTISISVKFGHCLFDISTGREGESSCITLMGADFECDDRVEEVRGPGKICKKIGITRDNRDYWTGAVIYGDRMWIEGDPVQPSEIERLEGNSENCLGIYRLKG